MLDFLKVNGEVNVIKLIISILISVGIGFTSTLFSMNTEQTYQFI